MPTSIRLDPATDRALEEIAARHAATKSQIVRRAIAELLERERRSPWERAADLVGSVTGGPDDLSEQTGRRFREALAAKRAAGS
jgi:hypothetical protein